LDIDNINIKKAEKILSDFDNLQESEPNFILRKLEDFNVTKNFDLFNTNLNNFCVFSQKDKLNQSASISLNYKDNLQDMNNKSNLELQNLRHQLENLTSGLLEINENSLLKIKSKSREKDEDKDKDKEKGRFKCESNLKDKSNTKDIYKHKDKDAISIITPLKSCSNFDIKFKGIGSNTGLGLGMDNSTIIDNCKGLRNNNNFKEKEFPIPQHSFINSSSTFINNMPTMQTDSSFLSNLDDNYILNNNMKGKKQNITK
jgi:hypothetical protein